MASEVQTVYNTAPRLTAFGRAAHFSVSYLAGLPSYQDINNNECFDRSNDTSTTEETTTNDTIGGD